MVKNERLSGEEIEKKNKGSEQLIGKIYKTVGGWDALIIYVAFSGQHFYAVHKPHTEEESAPVCHLLNGKSLTVFSVNERPCYENHPADIIFERRTK